MNKVRTYLNEELNIDSFKSKIKAAYIYNSYSDTVIRFSKTKKGEDITNSVEELVNYVKTNYYEVDYAIWEESLFKDYILIRGWILLDDGSFYRRELFSNIEEWEYIVPPTENSL